MGYDFHLTPAGPRLIEVNTNAGGALLNGLHTAVAVRSRRGSRACARTCCRSRRSEQRIVRTFVAEFEAVRGAGARPARVAIADERPREQFLYAGVRAVRVAVRAARGSARAICDTRGARARRAAASRCAASASTSSTCATPTSRSPAPRSRALRAAYLAREVVVTPAPREHHPAREQAPARAVLVARARSRSSASRRTTRASSPRWCRRRARSPSSAASAPGASASSGCSSPARRSAAAPSTAATRSRARKLEEIAGDADFLAQRRVEPGLLEVETSDGPREMKFDVRAYAYRDEILLLGARVYQGQVTNLRSAGGGFSAICVARAAESER